MVGSASEEVEGGVVVSAEGEGGVVVVRGEAGSTGSITSKGSSSVSIRCRRSSVAESDRFTAGKSKIGSGMGGGYCLAQGELHTA